MEHPGAESASGGPEPDQRGKQTVRLRSAQTHDLDFLDQLEGAAFEADRISRRSFRHFIAADTADLIVAEIAGNAVGYALVLFRHGTALARLYSIAVQPGMAGKGIAAALMDGAEQRAYRHGCIAMRLEVREDNLGAIRLYERRGFRRFGRYLDYYQDHADALRYEKLLGAGTAPAKGDQPPYFEQTLDFTCAPVCMMMALKWAGQDIAFDLPTELKLWREATTVYMTSGHGGCEPYGIAVALARRGLAVEIHASRRPPYFLESVRGREKRLVMKAVQSTFQTEAAELGIPVHHNRLSADGMRAALDSGAVVMLLVSGYRMFAKKVPHWLLLIGHDQTHAFVHDPWVEDKHFETRAAAANLPIPFGELDRMARYGRNKLQAAVIIRRKPRP
ncbi:MAG: peptidase C39 family protein [Rhodobiaceae bacterium]|nr:peptidase C39 family protein [Rhodobiaceae bacterium]